MAAINLHNCAGNRPAPVKQGNLGLLLSGKSTSNITKHMIQTHSQHTIKLQVSNSTGNLATSPVPGTVSQVSNGSSITG
jgi:hypothetical protein